MATEINTPTDTGFDIYLYVDKNTGEVADIFAYHLFGTSVRNNDEWTPTDREDSKLGEYLNSDNYKTYKVDWTKEPIIDADPNDEAAWEHQLVQAWDNDVEITESDLAKYTQEVNSGELEERNVPEDQINEG